MVDTNANNAGKSPKQAGELTIFDQVRKALANLSQLEIETTVEGGSTTRSMRSVINLVQGDIKNSIHQDFLTGDLKELLKFHESQVSKGQEIIQQNIASLKAIFEFIKDNGLQDETVAKDHG